MKTKLILVILLAFFQVASVFGAIPAESIHGRWSFIFVENGFTRSSVVSLSPKGKYSEYGTIADIINGREQDKKIRFQIQGSWELDGESVVVTVIKSTAPNHIQAGSIIRFKLFKVTESDITYINAATNKLYKAPKLDEP